MGTISEKRVRATSGSRFFDRSTESLVQATFTVPLSAQVNDRRPVSSVGRASDYRAGGLGFIQAMRGVPFNCRYLNPYIKLKLIELAITLYIEF